MSQADHYERLLAIVSRRARLARDLSPSVLAGIGFLLTEAAQLRAEGKLETAEEMLRWALRLSSG